LTGLSGIASFLSPNLPNSGTALSYIGKSLTTGNSASIGYKYVGSNNTANSLMLGHYGNNTGITLLNNATVGIGGVNPAYTLDVNGTGRFINGALLGFQVNANAASNNVVLSGAGTGSYLAFASWNSGAGYALLIITGSNSTTLVLNSSNSAGGNSAFDTSNGFGNNGSNGISIFIQAGYIYVQLRNNYSGGTVTVSLFGNII
jgi:hypothetical protein